MEKALSGWTLFIAIALQGWGCTPILDLFRSSPGIEHGNTVQEAPDVAPTDDVFAYGAPHACAVGAWVNYRILSGEGERFVKISLTAKDPVAARVEVLETVQGKRTLRIQDVSPERKVIRSWHVPPDAGGPPLPQEIRQRAGVTESEWPHREEAGREEVSNGSSPLWKNGVAIETIVTHQDGRIEFESSRWSADVPPLFAASPHGGLIKRTVEGGTTTELLERGADARPSVQIPPIR